MQQVREHPRVLWFVVTAAALTWLLSMAYSGIVSLDGLWQALKSLSVATSAAAAASFFLNRYLWYRWPCKLVLQIPDLRGRWVGWSCRRFENGEIVWRPSAHEISQRALDIAAEAWGPNNCTRSTCASVVSGSQRGSYEFVWSYDTVTVSPSPDNRAGDSHRGCSAPR